ncbi:MAG: prepilin-type N-terminal cleavage/methylation domain-containing protein [Candidatus Auribacterota bacterium]|jgi:prepilin-type N-terminal cleavage/methylation domain-containing protein/prepilin-type processing-associated H-X9-DG protein|nr:prepilin-type N-terminal cleavage/methylation domain-containing protein [Candidatus Auribacterota bacterium]
MKKLSHNKKQKGFSFLELLMVFSVISILSLLLLPSVHDMKEKGRQATCIGNQRQLAIAAILYANESGAMLPISIAGISGYLPADEYNASNPFESTVFAQNVMSDFYNRDFKLTHCPEVQGTILDDTPVHSYAFNVYITGVKLDMIESGATTVMTTDSHFEGVSSSDEVAFRHGDRVAIAAYVDGHIELFKGIIPPSRFTPQNDKDEDFEVPISDTPTDNPVADDPPPADNPPSPTYYPTVRDENGFDIDVGTIPGDGVVSITIDLSSTEDTNKALSHVSYTFGLNLPLNVLQAIADSAQSTYGYPVEVVNPDPQTGLIGIKFDETALGEDGAIELCTFRFDLPNDVFGNMENISVTTKAGTSVRTTVVSLVQ